MLYDKIGDGYDRTRKPDIRIADAVRTALGASASVVNLGAGSGAYEPDDRLVVAVEPSGTMLASRPRGSAPAACGRAEALPFADRSVAAVLAVLTVHHWTDQDAGFCECARVARERIVLLTWDPQSDGFWLVRDYLPSFLALDRAQFPAMMKIRAAFGPDARVTVEPMLVPHDCTDGFLGAYWRRPAAYLDPTVQSGISSFARQGGTVCTSAALSRLADDVASGTWDSRYAELLNVEALDVGYRLVTVHLG